MADTFNILISSAGRRVTLVNLFRNALRELGLHGEVHAADLTPWAAAWHAADRAHKAPKFASGQFIAEMLELCKREQIRLVVPTIDPELPLYAKAIDRFAEIGTRLAISSPETIEIGGDKALTHRWLSGLGLPVPRQASIDEVLASPGDWPTPLIVKRARGSSSIGMHLIDHHDQLPQINVSEPVVVESVASGEEYTITVYIDREGRPRCAVPRLRSETRAGEVSKGMTVRHAALQQTAEQIAEALPGAWGVINIQIFYDQATQTQSIIEINPRFGGGYPLSHQAGVTCTHWLIQECLGLPLNIEPDVWRDGVVMLRYDDAVFIDKSEIQGT